MVKAKPTSIIWMVTIRGNAKALQHPRDIEEMGGATDNRKYMIRKSLRSEAMEPTSPAPC